MPMEPMIAVCSDFAPVIGAKSSENERLLTALSDSIDEINSNSILGCG